jgi:deoxyribonuclease-4
MLEESTRTGQDDGSGEEGAPLGAHVSARGGVERAPARAVASGANAIQIFTSAPQRWSAAAISDEAAAAFRHGVVETEIRTTVAHDSYLINLATDRDELLARSISAFHAELERSTLLGLDLLVTHPGNATGGDRAEALDRNARAVAEALASFPDGPTVLFETTAGSGTALGYRFEELVALLECIPAEYSDRVGICLDTAHVFAAGYDVCSDPISVLDEFDRVIGLEHLLLFHLNDSAGALGSRRDRHADIGDGNIGAESFGQLLRDPRVKHVPGILETPKGDDPAASDRRNLTRLRTLRAVSSIR